MANTITGYGNFRYLVLSEVKVRYYKDNDPFYTDYLFERSAICEGSSANIEEIKIGNQNVGIKSTINLVLNESDYTNIAFITQTNEESILSIIYKLQNCQGISVPDQTITVTHSGNLYNTINSSGVEGEYHNPTINITVIDPKRHITDVMVTS